jgi:NADPH2:quinone reductase
MKAIRIHSFGDPDVMKLEDVPTPAPAAGQVLVDVRSIGVNPVDTYICTGKYGARPFPHTPGFDAAGIVESVGDGVTSVKKGDRVYVSRTISGAYAEKTLADQANVYPLPENVGFDEGAALGVPFGTAYRALHHRGQAKPAETVLVHGATGGVGIATVELAHARGLRVIGSGGTESGLATVREHGADVVVNHRTPGYTDEIMRATNGRGVDVIVEMAAHINLDRDLTLLAKGGRVVVVGNRGRVEIDPRQAMGRDAAILGLMLFNTSDRDLAEIHAAITSGLANGTLNPVIAKELPLADAARAHEAVMEPGALGKIVLIP